MKIFKILDRYIMRQFIGGFTFTLLLIVSISITIDLGEHINKFVQNDLTFHQVFFGFYIYFIPYIVTFLGPYFVFITVIYFTSRLANRSEIIAMFNSGMSFARLLVPYIITSTFIAIGLWFAINYIVPSTDKKRLAFENKYIAFQPTSSENNIHRAINDSQFFYFRIYDNIQQTAFNVSLETIKKDKLIQKTMAERAQYYPEFKQWKIYNYFIRTIDGDKEIMTKGDSTIMYISMDPTILVKRWTYIQELNRDELKEIIREQKEQGSNNYKIFQLELYKRTSKCVGIIILTIIGVIIASKKVRGGLGLHLMFGMLIGSIYEVIIKFADSFAIKSSLNPLLATWIPNILYIILALILWKKYQD